MHTFEKISKGVIFLDLKNLCLSLAYSNTEEEVINILKAEGLWENDEAWRYYGDTENNFATIGNQQSSPEAALTEKIINSVDAVLMAECLSRGINPGFFRKSYELKHEYFSFRKIGNPFKLPNCVFALEFVSSLATS